MPDSLGLLKPQRRGEVSRTKTPEQYEAEYNWLSTEQAAKRIGMSTGFVLKMIRQGHLKPPGVLNVSRSARSGT